MVHASLTASLISDRKIAFTWRIPVLLIWLGFVYLYVPDIHRWYGDHAILVLAVACCTTLVLDGIVCLTHREKPIRYSLRDIAEVMVFVAVVSAYVGQLFQTRMPEYTSQSSLLLDLLLETGFGIVGAGISFAFLRIAKFDLANVSLLLATTVGGIFLSYLGSASGRIFLHWTLVQYAVFILILGLAIVFTKAIQALINENHQPTLEDVADLK